MNENNLLKAKNPRLNKDVTHVTKQTVAIRSQSAGL